MTMPADGSWYDLYPKGRSKDPLYTKESTSHPAKMSLPLARRIIQELLEYGWLKPGGGVLDPFGGRGSSAIEWCKLDPANWAVTCELEQPFHQMSLDNRDCAEAVLGRPINWLAINGDSRAMDQFFSVGHNGDRTVITSPPYGKGVIGSSTEKQAERLRALTNDPTSSLFGRDPNGAWFQAMINGYQASPGNIDLAPIDGDYRDLESAVVTSPVYPGVEVRDYGGSIGDAWKEGKAAREGFGDVDGTGRDLRHYGKTEGQIGNARDDTEQVLAAVGSPPYEDSLSGDDPVKRGGLFRDPKRANDKALTANYNSVSISSPPYDGMKVAVQGAGDNQEFNQTYAAWRKDPTAENFEKHQAARRNMQVRGYTDGSVAAVGSPPFEAQSGGHPVIESGPLADPKLHARHAASRIGPAGGYSESTDGQIGNKKGDTYATMTRDVYRALHRAGAQYAVMVTKNPVKNQQLKRLDLLTIKLMEDAGFELVARRRAYLWQTVGELRERGIIFPKPEAPKGKLDAAFWDKWDERPVGEISFFNVVHLCQGRRAPSKYEDVLFFKRAD